MIKFSQRNSKLPLPWRKQVIYPVIPIYGAWLTATWTTCCIYFLVRVPKTPDWTSWVGSISRSYINSAPTCGSNRLLTTSVWSPSTSSTNYDAIWMTEKPRNGLFITCSSLVSYFYANPVSAASGSLSLIWTPSVLLTFNFFVRPQHLQVASTPLSTLDWTTFVSLNCNDQKKGSVVNPSGMFSPSTSIPTQCNGSYCGSTNFMVILLCPQCTYFPSKYPLSVEES